MNIRIPFWRGEGCANTFIVFDLIASPELFTEDFIQKAHRALLEEKCDDALILLPTQEPRTFVMKVLEPDGSFAQFCGNGSRVIAAYLTQRYNRTNSEHGGSSCTDLDSLSKNYFNRDCPKLDYPKRGLLLPCLR